MKTIVAVLVLAIATLANVAQAAEPTAWDKWGVAPYARNLNEACKKAPAAINGFNWPKAVKEHFIEKLGAVCKSDKGVWLTPDMLLEQMWSGPDSHHTESHVMDKRRVGELPVLRSPDGRPYNKGSVAETAYSFSWTFVYEGKTYVLYLPLVCFNWSWTFGPPVAVVEQCVELAFNARIGGKVRWGIVTSAGRALLPHACNKQKQGSGAWVSFYGDCEICIVVDDYVRKLGSSWRAFQKFMYPVTATEQVLSFSTEIWTDVVYICLEDAAGKSTCNIMHMKLEDWKGRYRVSVPDGWIFEGDTNCPK